MPNPIRKKIAHNQISGYKVQPVAGIEGSKIKGKRGKGKQRRKKMPHSRARVPWLWQPQEGRRKGVGGGG